MAEFLSTQGKKAAVEMQTTGFQEQLKQFEELEKNLEKKHAKAHTSKVALTLKAEMKKRVRRNDRSYNEADTNTETDRDKWPEPLWKAILVRSLKRKAFTQHGHIGHRVHVRGRGYGARMAWLEYGKKNRDGSISRKYPFIKPSRVVVESKADMLGRLGIMQKMDRDARRSAAKIRAKKDKWQ